MRHDALRRVVSRDQELDRWASVIAQAFEAADLDVVSAAIESGDSDAIARSLNLSPVELWRAIAFMHSRGQELTAAFPELTQYAARMRRA
jgi:hypothetical protein